MRIRTILKTSTNKYADYYYSTIKKEIFFFKNSYTCDVDVTDAVEQGLPTYLVSMK